MKYKNLISNNIHRTYDFCFVGCQQNNTIIKPDIETKTVTENSEGDYITFFHLIFLQTGNYTLRIIHLLLVLVLMQTKTNASEKYFSLQIKYR